MNYIDVYKMLKTAATPQQWQETTMPAGKTLGWMANKYNTTVDQLARVNHISNPDVVAANRKMLVPYAAPQQPYALSDTDANRVADILWTLESGRGQWLTNPKSSARGHYHWLKGTWGDFQKRYPNETANMTQANLDDYDTATKFQVMKLKDDAKRFHKATGKAPGDADLLAIHYGGFGGRNTPAAKAYGQKGINPNLKKDLGYE